MTDPIRIRASSFADLLDCPHRWEARNLLGIRLPSSGEATLGTAVHAGTALFDSRAGTVRDAIDCAREHIAHPKEETLWNSAELSARDADKMAATMTAGYCATFERAEWLAVERNFAPLVVDVGDVQIELTGSADRIARLENGLSAVADIKTGRNIIDSNGEIKAGQYRAQLAVYELLAEADTGQAMTEAPMIIGIKATKTCADIKVASVPDAKTALLGTDNQPGLLQMAAAMLKTGMFPPNPRSSLCSPKFCPRYTTCAFR